MPTAYERALTALAPEVIAETVRITELPAPTGRERTRARYVHSLFDRIGGWDELTIDGIGNVIAIRRGRSDAARVLVGAHLDTVFPDAETPVTRSRGRLHGRGVGDNSAGVVDVGPDFRYRPAGARGLDSNRQRVRSDGGRAEQRRDDHVFVDDHRGRRCSAEVRIVTPPSDEFVALGGNCRERDRFPFVVHATPLGRNGLAGARGLHAHG